MQLSSTNETLYDVWALLDLRGLIIHSYSSGADPDSDNKKIRSPGHTVDLFIDRYLLPISKLVPLNRIICINDAGKEFRKTLDAEYKTRPEMEPAHKMAVELSVNAIRELLHALGILQCSVAGTEADDVIAYLNQKLPGRKLIYTVDGDLIALASSTTTVFMKGEPHPDYIYKTKLKGEPVRITIKPRHVTLFKSLVGDASDNIKGIPGLGPSTWLDMVREFGEDGLDELVELADTGNFGRLKTLADQTQDPLLIKLYQGVQPWSRSWALAKLHPELVEAKHGNEFRRIKWEKRLPSRERLQKLALSTGNGWLEEDLNHLLPIQSLVLKGDWDESVLAEAERLFKASRFVSIDWETASEVHEPFLKASEGTYVDMLGSWIVGAGFTCGYNLEYTFYINFGHADEENRVSKDQLIELLERIPEGMPIIAQNAMFEQTVFNSEFGYTLPNLHDTKIMASHVDESLPAGLKDMSKHWLNYNQIRYDQVIEKGRTMADYPAEHVFAYGADDPLVTAHLYDLFYTILVIEGTWDFVKNYEFPMIYTLSDAYLAGVSIDYDEVERQRSEDQETFDRNLLQVRQLLRDNVNPDTIKAGAANWREELVANHKAEAEYLIKLVTQYEKEHGNGLGQVLLKDRAVMRWAASSVTETSTADEVILAIQEKLARDVLLDSEVRKDVSVLNNEALKAATYCEFEVAHKPPHFSWTLGKINQLAEAFQLPVWPCINDLPRMNAHITTLADLTVTQAHYLEMVVDCAEEAAKDKHTKCAAYAWLKKEYTTRFQGTAEKSGTELNMDSPKQMCELLYAILGLPIRVRNPSISDNRELRGLEGAPQADKDAFAMAIAVGDATGWKREVLDLLTAAKDANTRIKFFYNKLPLWKHPVDGLIHPQFNSTGTETRRPTGSSPNLLQLSKKGEGIKVRRCFVPNAKLGHDLIVTCDWSAQEIRVNAALSGDPTLTACYVGDNKVDVHSAVAANIMGIGYLDFLKGLRSEDEKEAKRYKDYRAKAKSTVFGSAYGIGRNKLARQILCTPEEAGVFLDAKKATYPKVEEWKDQVKQQLHAQGYVSTLYGSRKHLFNKLANPDEGLVAYYERAAINYLIQSLCADYLKVVLADVYSRQVFERYNAVLLAPIYDEICASVHSSQAVGFITELYRSMIQGIPGVNIPMLCNPALGVNLADQLDILVDENDTLTEVKIQEAINKVLKVKTQEAE